MKYLRIRPLGNFFVLEKFIWHRFVDTELRLCQWEGIEAFETIEEAYDFAGAV